jgi:hypothetical protein
VRQFWPPGARSLKGRRARSPPRVLARRTRPATRGGRRTGSSRSGCAAHSLERGRPQPRRETLDTASRGEDASRFFPRNAAYCACFCRSCANSKVNPAGGSSAIGVPGPWKVAVQPEMEILMRSTRRSSAASPQSDRAACQACGYAGQQRLNANQDADGNGFSARKSINGFLFPAEQQDPE